MPKNFSKSKEEAEIDSLYENKAFMTKFRVPSHPEHKAAVELLEKLLEKLLKRNVEHLLQQDKSLLRKACYEKHLASDEEGYSNFFGAVTAHEVKTPPADAAITSTPHTRRKIITKPYYWADMLDYEDSVRTIHHYDGYFAQAGSMAFKRKMDEVIMKAIFGVALADKVGQDAITFPSKQVIPVNYVLDGAQADSGITVDKIRRAVEMLQLEDVRADEKKYLILSPHQKIELLEDLKATFVDGEINQFLGVSFITYNNVPKDSNGYRRCALVTENAIHFAMKREINVNVDKLPQKQNLTQVYVSADFGATRMSEKHVVEIKCLET